MSDKPAWLKPHGTPWGVSSSKVVYDNPWITVTEYQAIAPTGRPALYGKIGFKNQAIGIVPLHDDGTVTLVGQNRFSLANYSWELPEGGAPHGEDPLDGAKRELAEEVGLRAADCCRSSRASRSERRRSFSFMSSFVNSAPSANVECV